MAFLENHGFCNNWMSQTTFSAENDWLRDNYLCVNCGSLPRERALMEVVQRYYPEWRHLTIHETSPAQRGASARLKRECESYIATQFWPSKPRGAIVEGVRCENIESLTFEDNSIDLHISQDVLEHILDPYAEFREISRTLRPGGAHICTVPLVQKERPSRRRARMGLDGVIESDSR